MNYRELFTQFRAVIILHFTKKTILKYLKKVLELIDFHVKPCILKSLQLEKLSTDDTQNLCATLYFRCATFLKK